jgi:Flp pilus assembly protein TadD
MSLLLEALKKAAQEKQAQQKHSSPPDGQASAGSAAPAGPEPSPELALEPVTEYQVPDEDTELGADSNDLPRKQGVALQQPGTDPSGKSDEPSPSVQPPDAGKASSLPQMQGAQAAAGLSPEAAKQVFDSKRISSPRRTRLLVLGVMGVVVLMAVLLSLFYYSSQVSNLDQQISTFKREPRAMSPPPPRTQVPAAGQQAATGQEGVPPKGSESGEVDRRGSGAPIIDQIEEGVVSAGGTGNLAETGARVEKPAPRQPSESPSGDRVATSDLKIERRGSGGSLKVTSGTSSTGGQREGIVLRSGSRIPDADRLLLEAFKAYRAGDLDGAEQAYAQVLRSRSDDRDALLGLAAILQRRGSSAGALTIYQRLLELDPKDSVARSAVLDLSAAQGIVRESDLKIMLRDQPGAAYLHFALGNVYAGSGRWSQAQGAYFDAYRLAPTNPDYAFNLAVSLDQLGKQDVARRYYQQAVNAARAGAVVSFSVQGAERRLQVISQTAPEG